MARTRGTDIVRCRTRRKSRGSRMGGPKTLRKAQPSLIQHQPRDQPENLPGLIFDNPAKPSDTPSIAYPTPLRFFAATKPKTVTNKVDKVGAAAENDQNGFEADDLACNCAEEMSSTRRKWMALSVAAQQTMQAELVLQMQHEQGCCNHECDREDVENWLTSQVRSLQNTVNALQTMRSLRKGRK